MASSTTATRLPADRFASELGIRYCAEYSSPVPVETRSV
jgi:hypothetical protein